MQSFELQWFVYQYLPTWLKHSLEKLCLSWVDAFPLETSSQSPNQKRNHPTSHQSTIMNCVCLGTASDILESSYLTSSKNSRARHIKLPSATCRWERQCRKVVVNYQGFDLPTSVINREVFPGTPPWASLPPKHSMSCPLIRAGY